MTLGIRHLPALAAALAKALVVAQRLIGVPNDRPRSSPRRADPARGLLGPGPKGWYETIKTGDGFNAFDAAGKPLGRFTSEGAASYAIVTGLLPRQAGGRL